VAVVESALGEQNNQVTKFLELLQTEADKQSEADKKKSAGIVITDTACKN
jgi:hypothetical protein